MQNRDWCGDQQIFPNQSSGRRTWQYRVQIRDVAGFHQLHVQIMTSPTCTRIATPQGSKFQHLMHTRDVREYNYTCRNYSSFGHGLYVNFAVRRDYSSPAACALPQQCRAPRLLVIRPHGLYVNLAVHREYSFPGRSGSTSTTPYAAATSSSGRTTTSTTYLD
jgi:hypothetical protein